MGLFFIGPGHAGCFQCGGQGHSSLSLRMPTSGGPLSRCSNIIPLEKFPVFLYNKRKSRRKPALMRRSFYETA